MQEQLHRNWRRVLAKYHYYDRRLWLLLIIRMVNSIGFSIILPFISIYLHAEQHVSMTLIGSIFLGVAVVRSVMQLVGGTSADKYNRRRVMLFAGVGRTFALFLLAVAVLAHLPIYVIGLAIFLAYGFGSMFMPAADALVSDLVLPKDRIEAYGLQRMGFNLGWAIGPALGGYLASVSYSLIFFLSGLFFVIAVIIIYYYMPDSKNLSSQSQFNIRDLRKIVTHRTFIIFGLLSMIIFSILTQIVTTLSVFSIEVLNISKIQLGYLYTINGGVILLFQIYGIRKIKRMTLTRAQSIGAMFAAASYLVVAISVNFWWLAVAIILLTFGEIFFIPAGATLVSNIAPEPLKATYLGVYGLFQSVGRSIGPFYGGILADHFLRQPLILWGVLSGIGMVGALGFTVIQKFLSSNVNQNNR
ncbi:MAG: MDR family MFS transporter [Candidatus Zhuqueibacterota bacterium]